MKDTHPNGTNGSLGGSQHSRRFAQLEKSNATPGAAIGNVKHRTRRGMHLDRIYGKTVTPCTWKTPGSASGPMFIPGKSRPMKCRIICEKRKNENVFVAARSEGLKFRFGFKTTAVWHPTNTRLRGLLI